MKESAFGDHCTAPLPSVVDNERRLPTLIASAGSQTQRRFAEFFAVSIRNPHTRRAYLRASLRFFDWCAERGMASIEDITPFAVAAHVEALQAARSVETGTGLAVPSVKQSLAALRKLFDWMVVGQIIPTNPAHAVRGPSHVVLSGKTPPLDSDQVRTLFDSIGAATLSCLRDRAVIAVMAYGFARIGAVVSMRVEDYYQQGKRCKFRLHEKNGKVIQIPVHHAAEEYLDAYIQASSLAEQKHAPLFRTIDRRGQLTLRAMTGNDALRMVKRRAKVAGLPDTVRNHTFRATSATVYLTNGGRLEHAQRLMGHSDPRTTKLYDHTSEALTLDEVEKISY